MPILTALGIKKRNVANGLPCRQWRPYRVGSLADDSLAMLDDDFKRPNVGLLSQRRPSSVAVASRISSDSAGSSTARDRMSAPTRPAIVASAFSRRAA